MARALDWLKGKDPGKLDELDDPFDLESSSAKSMEQEKAEAMAKALGWLRNKEGDFDLSFERFGHDVIGKSKFSAVANKADCDLVAANKLDNRSADIEKALNWLRYHDSVVDDALLDPSGMFKKLDSTLPQKAGVAEEDRAADMANAIAWMREKGLVPDAYYSVPDFETVASVGVTTRSAEQRTSDLDDALNWLRHKGEDDGKYDPTGEFCKLDGMLPVRRKQSKEERAREIRGALDWLRSMNVGCSGPELVPGFGKVPPMKMSKRSPEERTRDLRSAFNWIRKGKGKSKKYDPSGEFTNGLSKSSCMTAT
jgi:hypothetical protein